MDPYAHQQFDFFFNTAIDRFVERIEHRCGGPVPALAQLRREPQGEGIWADEFVSALFTDFLLDNPAGAAFVLQALARRPVGEGMGAGALGHTMGHTIGDWLQHASRVAFAGMLIAKTDEALEQRLAFQVTD